jgi:hypothetical protein
MPQLIRIGNRIVNLLHVKGFQIESEIIVNVFMDDGTEPQFLDDEARALAKFLSDDRYVQTYSPDPPDFGVISL